MTKASIFCVGFDFKGKLPDISNFWLKEAMVGTKSFLKGLEIKPNQLSIAFSCLSSI